MLLYFYRQIIWQPITYHIFLQDDHVIIMGAYSTHSAYAMRRNSAVRIPGALLDSGLGE